jgi:hypothetical protein
VAAVVPPVVPAEPLGVVLLVELLEGAVDPPAVVVLEGLLALAAIEGSTVPTLLLEGVFEVAAPDPTVEFLIDGEALGGVSAAVFFFFALDVGAVGAVGAGAVETLAGWTTAAAIAAVAVATVG